MRLTKKLCFAMILIWGALFWSCEAINPTDSSELTDYTCEGCHTSRTTLNRIITTLNLDPPAEGSEAPG